MVADFEKQSYWHGRFKTETSFEWLVTSETFVSIIRPFLDRLDSSARILHLGSGTSDLHNYLRSRGLTNVTNVDYEPLAIERGRQLEEQAFGNVRTAYTVADVTQLHLPEKFDLVVDKSTIDAVSCGGETAVKRMATSVCRCLAPEGVWISLSYSSTRFQLPGLSCHVEAITKIPTPKTRPHDPDIYYWLYLLRPRS